KTAPRPAIASNAPRVASGASSPRSPAPRAGSGGGGGGSPIRTTVHRDRPDGHVRSDSVLGVERDELQQQRDGPVGDRKEDRFRPLRGDSRARGPARPDE